MGLSNAGWHILPLVADDVVPPRWTMIVADDHTERAQAIRWSGSGRLVIGIRDDMADGSHVDYPVISASLSLVQLTLLFKQWLPPDIGSLRRMESVLGRAEITPIVRGLRDTLHAALESVDMIDAHNLAGLSGTLGFTALSESWRAVDTGDAPCDAALAPTRAALLAIESWLGPNDD